MWPLPACCSASITSGTKHSVDVGPQPWPPLSLPCSATPSLEQIAVRSLSCYHSLPDPLALGNWMLLCSLKQEQGSNIVFSKSSQVDQLW